MAIVINGSGTVTGISVGGLPDDIVDAGTLADNAVGIAQMAGGTDGNIITYDTSGNPAVVATGSDGQILTSAGADAVPAFEAAPGGGKILQVVNATKLDTFSSSAMAGGAYVDVTDLSVAITPASASNKIFVQVQYNGSCSTATPNYGTSFGIAIYKSATGITDGLISIGDADSNRSRTTSMFNNTAGDNSRNIYAIPLIIYDTTGTTNEITYKVQLTQGQNSGSGISILHCNRTGGDGDNYSGMRATSTITVMEIEV